MRGAGIAKASGLILVTDAMVALVAGFLLVPLYTRAMPMDQYGIVVTVGVVVSVLQMLFAFSLSSAYLRYYYDLEEEQRPAFGGGLLTVVILLTVGLSAVAMVVGPWLQPLLFPHTGLAPLAWSLGLSAIYALRMLIGSTLRLQFRFKALAAIAVAQCVLLVALALWLVRGLHLGFTGWALSQALALGIPSLVSVYLVRHDLKLGWPKEQLRRAFQFSWPLVISGLAWLAINRSAVILLQNLRNLQEAAVYGVIYAFGMLLMTVGTALDKVNAPVFYRDIATPDGPRHWSRLTTLTVGFVAWIALALCLLAPPAFRLMFNPEYQRGLPYLPLIVWAFVAKVSDIFLLRVLLYRDRTALLLALQVAVGILNVLLNLWLVPKYGMAGAAYVTLGCFALNTVVGLTISTVLMPLPYEWGRLAVLVFGAAGLSWLGWTYLGMRGTLVATSGALVGLALHGALLLLLGRVPVSRLWRRTPATPAPEAT